MCTTAHCTKVRRYIFLPQRNPTIYCQLCILGGTNHLFKICESLECTKCGRVSSLHSALTFFKLIIIDPTSKLNKAVGCKSCIHSLNPKLTISKDYIDSSKFNLNKLCCFVSIIDVEYRKTCFKEISFTPASPLTAFVDTVSVGYCSEHMKSQNSQVKRKYIYI
jgi:hypothetical protein